MAWVSGMGFEGCLEGLLCKVSGIEIQGCSVQGLRRNDHSP